MRHDPRLERALIKYGFIAPLVASGVLGMMWLVAPASVAPAQFVAAGITAGVAGVMWLTGRHRPVLLVVTGWLAVTFSQGLGRTDSSLIGASLALVVTAAIGTVFVGDDRRTTYQLTSTAATGLVGLWWEGTTPEGLGLTAMLAGFTWVLTWLLGWVEQSRSQSEARYRTLFEHSPIALLQQNWSRVRPVLDEIHSDGTTVADAVERRPELLEDVISRIETVEVNRAAESLLGVPRSEILGPWRDHRLNDHSRPYLIQALDAMLHGVTAGSDEYVTTTFDGALAETKIDWSDLDPETIPGVDRVVAVTDIAELKQVQRELAERIASHDRFLAAVSHELRSPLASISGFAEILAGPDAVPESDRERMVELILTEARGMSYLVEDLLVASRDQGQISIRRERIPLDRIAVKVAEMIRMDDLDTRRPSHLPVALGDSVRVTQIVRNLLLNARRHGGARRSMRFGSDADTVWVDVGDDGDPIAPEYHESIFDAHGAHPTRHSHSIGVGLAVSRNLAILMNGSLSLHRIDDENVFRLSLPRP